MLSPMGTIWIVFARAVLQAPALTAQQIAAVRGKMGKVFIEFS
jgi:hypothetical protein